MIMTVEQKMKVYIGAKIIHAAPLCKYGFAKDRGRDLVGNDEPGYVVRDPDGYISWSPKEVFEQAYREVSAAERKLIED